MFNFKKITAILIFAFLFWGCFDTPRQEKAEELNILSTTSLVTHVVSQVAREHLKVYGLMSAGQNPHSYEPTPKDMATVEEADLIFVNGFNLEEGLMDSLKTVARGKIIPVSRDIASLPFDGKVEEHHEEEGDDHHLEEEEDHHEEGDPHTYTSPLNVISWVKVVEEALIEADSENKKEYKQNAQDYVLKLNSLHNWIQEELKEIPQDQRVLITDHASLGYFAAEYGFQVMGTLIPSFSVNSESSAKKISELIKVMKEKEISTLFIDHAAGRDIENLAEMIKREVGEAVEIRILRIGSPASRDGKTESYISMMEYNVSQIKAGLAP